MTRTPPDLVVFLYFLSPSQDIVEWAVLPVGFHQVIIYHLDIPPGHIKRGVTEQALEMDRVHASP